MEKGKAERLWRIAVQRSAAHHTSLIRGGCFWVCFSLFCNMTSGGVPESRTRSRNFMTSAAVDELASLSSFQVGSISVSEGGQVINRPSSSVPVTLPVSFLEMGGWHTRHTPPPPRIIHIPPPFTTSISRGGCGRRSRRTRSGPLHNIFQVLRDLVQSNLFNAPLAA